MAIIGFACFAMPTAAQAAKRCPSFSYDDVKVTQLKVSYVSCKKGRSVVRRYYDNVPVVDGTTIFDDVAFGDWECEYLGGDASHRRTIFRCISGEWVVSWKGE